MVVGYVNEIPSLSLVATFVEPMLATFVWIRRLGSVVRQPLLSTRWSDARTWKVEYLMERDVRVEKGKEKTLLSLQVLAAQLLLPAARLGLRARRRFHPSACASQLRPQHS